jgi:hypothetical protein
VLYVEFFVRKVKQRAEKGPEQTWTNVKKALFSSLTGFAISLGAALLAWLPYP